jgi:hypothetical protein
MKQLQESARMSPNTTKVESTATSQRVTKQAHAQSICRSGISVPIHGSSKRPICSTPDPNRGRMRKLTDALLKLVGRDPYLDPFMCKQWD